MNNVKFKARRKKQKNYSEYWIEHPPYMWSGSKWYNADKLTIIFKTNRVDVKKRGISTIAIVDNSKLMLCLQQLKIATIKSGHTGKICYEKMIYPVITGKSKRRCECTFIYSGLN